MCGRYAQYLPPEAIVRLFHALNATTNHAISATNALFGSVQPNGAMHFEFIPENGGGEGVRLKGRV
jgi:hypothetical protein